MLSVNLNCVLLFVVQLESLLKVLDDAGKVTNAQTKKTWSCTIFVFSAQRSLNTGQILYFDEHLVY